MIISNALKSDGLGTISEVIEGVETCVENGAKVISLSLAGPHASDIADDFYKELYEEKDILIIAASGNDGKNIYNYPSSFSSVISTAAIDENENIAKFSVYNKQVEISAPGVHVESTVPFNNYESFSGTSMATPHVAGVVGLLWMYFPECKNYQIRNVLAATAKQMNGLCCNEHTGYGLVQAKDAYELLSQGGCGGDIGGKATGGCMQLHQTMNSASSTCKLEPSCDNYDICAVDCSKCDTSFIDTSLCKMRHFFSCDIEF